MIARRPLLAAFLFVLVGAFFAGAAPARAQELEKLEFVTRSGVHAFSVEVMRTPDQQAKGLMFRRYMPDDRGMLFAFGRNEIVHMWMKNTYIPLDMLFLRADGRIINIIENVPPETLDSRPSDGPARAALELPGGTAARLGIRAGDRVVHDRLAGR